VIRIVTETGLRVYKELASMQKEQIDLSNKVLFIADSKTPTGVAEVPLTDIAVEAFGVRSNWLALAHGSFPMIVTGQATRRRSRRSGGQGSGKQACGTFGFTTCGLPMLPASRPGVWLTNG
jgi:hypothetical protein